MVIVRDESRPILRGEDVVTARKLVREWSVAAGFGIVDQTKMVTAASELARNMVQHGGGGVMRLQSLDDEARRGLRVTFEDQGPGISDVEQALRDGYSSGNGLGLGLGGARRLSDEFAIHTEPGRGTRVTITRWT